MKKKTWYLIVDCKGKAWPTTTDWKFVCPSKAAAKRHIEEEEGMMGRNEKMHLPLSFIPLKLDTCE